MSTLTNILSDGAILSFFTTLWMILALWLNPRIFLHDSPAKIQEKVAPKTRFAVFYTGLFIQSWVE